MIIEKITAILAGMLGPDAPAALSVPEDPKFGHYATNIAMRLAKARGEVPLELAKKLAEEIMRKAPAGFFAKVEAAPPGFINFWLTHEALQKEFVEVSREKNFGMGDVGRGKKVIVEYSQPNIAKTLNLGHFRTTIIGDALANILEAQQYRVVRWNYLGDWGTQFGKLVVAYKRWGDKAAVQNNPIEELQKLYVRFHDEAKLDPELEKQGQAEFKKLETGDRENRKLWKWFKDESIRELKKIYATLGVDFDVWIGESFFEEEMKPLVAEIMKKGIAEKSEGALVVRLDEYNLQPALIEKSDGASLYLTRDIANLRYRLKKYKPAKILYVVSNEQSYHFEQLFAVAKKFGLAGTGSNASASPELVHIKYGLVLGEGGKKLSTREGRTVSLDGAIQKAVALARKIVDEKARDLSEVEKGEVARAVGIGALKYNDLKENRMTDIVFDWDKMLDFSGDSAPYLQYTYARLQSILRKANVELRDTKYDAKNHFKELGTDDELALVRKIFELPDVVQKSGELYATSILATYLYKLAVAANKFYETTPILKDENVARRNARLVLIAVAARTIKNALALLGIEAPEKI